MEPMCRRKSNPKEFVHFAVKTIADAIDVCYCISLALVMSLQAPGVYEKKNEQSGLRDFKKKKMPKILVFTTHFMWNLSNPVIFFFFCSPNIYSSRSARFAC